MNGVDLTEVVSSLFLVVVIAVLVAMFLHDGWYALLDLVGDGTRWFIARRKRKLTQNQVQP